MSGHLTPQPPLRRAERGSWMTGLLVMAGLLTVAGMGIATYLTFVHYADQPIVCSTGTERPAKGSPAGKRRRWTGRGYHWS